LEIETIKGYIETYIASIPAMESWNTWIDLDIIRPGKIERIVHKGKEEQSRVYMAWFAKTPFTEELSITAQVLSEYLDIRTTEEIREKLGGVYSISAGVSVSPVPRGEISMRIIFACDPRRAQELSDAVMDLLNQAANSIDRDVFDKAVEALQKEWEISMQSNAFIAQSFANSSVLLNLPLSRLQRRPQYINAVTPADIQRMCALLLQSDSHGPVQVVLFPE
jgi:zinc protease